MKTINKKLKMKKLLTFHGDAKLKEDLLAEIMKHQQADRIVQGTYVNDNKKDLWRGCNIGCAIKSLNDLKLTRFLLDDHSIFPEQFGIPVIIALLSDFIFEDLSFQESKTFPYKFMSAIPVGVDIDPVWKKLLAWSLIDPIDGIVKYC